MYIYVYITGHDESREMLLNAFQSVLFQLPPTEGTGPKILTPKQMLQM